MLIDAHAHLDHYDEPREALARIESRRILTLANSMDPDSYERNLALAEGCPFVLPSFGIHPRRAAEHADHLAELRPLVERSPMLGELGLDFHWVRDTGHISAPDTGVRVPRPRGGQTRPRSSTSIPRARSSASSTPCALSA